MYIKFINLQIGRKGTKKNAYVQEKREFLNKKDRLIYLIENVTLIVHYS